MFKSVCVFVMSALIMSCAGAAPVKFNAEPEPAPAKDVEAPEEAPAEIEIPLREETKEVAVEGEIIGIAPVIIPADPSPPKRVSDLAAKIVSWRNKVHKGIWYECGKKYSPEEIEDAALDWASAIIAADANTEYKYRGKMRKVPIQEATGTMINESQFDRCAMGPYPRIFAYKHKILKRRKGTLSHTMEELEKVFTHRRFQGRKADIGPGQIVKRIGKNHLSWEAAQSYFALESGVDHVWKEMARRGEMYRTKHPSSRWPGSANHMYYTKKVVRAAYWIFN